MSLPRFVLLAGVCWTLAATSLTPAASAGHDHPLDQAACDYRDAVAHFETESDRAHCLDRYTETAIDRLNVAAGVFRSAARNPHKFDRLIDRWYEVSALQNRVDASIRSGAVPPQLLRCWQDVVATHRIVAAYLEEGLAGGIAPVHPIAPIVVTPLPGYSSSRLSPRPNDLFPPTYRAEPFPQDRFAPPTFPQRVLPQPPFGQSPFSQSGFGGAGASWQEAFPTAPQRDFGRQTQLSRTGRIISIGAELMRMMEQR